MEKLPGFWRADTLLDLILRFPELQSQDKNRDFLRYRTPFRTFSWSYLETFRKAHKIRRYLEKQDVERGAPVMIWGPNSPFWIWVYFGALLHGSPVVPIDMGSRTSFVERVASETGCPVLFRSRLTSAPDSPGHQVYLEELQDLLGEVSYRKKVPGDISPESLAAIMYTSGTTGSPKGTKLTHHNLLSNLKDLHRGIQIEFDPYPIALSLLPLSHAFEQMAGFWYPTSFRGRITYIQSRKPSEIFRALQKERPNIIISVPRLLELFKKKIERRFSEWVPEHYLRRMREGIRSFPRPFRKGLLYLIHQQLGGRIRCFVSGGAALDPEVEQFWFDLGFQVFQGYGLTETSPILTCNAPLKLRKGTVGKPLPNVKLRVSDENEILAKGENVFSGYFKQPEKTEEVLKDGWFHTGDIGEIDEDGFLRIRGRKKNVIVTPDGMNVYPKDLEEKLNEHSLIKDSCVVSHDQRICAILLPDFDEEESSSSEQQAPPNEGDHSIEEGEFEERFESILRETNQELAEHQQIQDWAIWQEQDFPRTTTLKVKRHEVQKEVPDLLESSRSVEEIATNTDRHPVIDLIANQADVSKSDVQKDLRMGPDLGLSSLDRLELVTKVEEQLFLDVNEEQVQSSTTVGEFIEYIEQEQESEDHAREARSWTRWGLVQTIRRSTQQGAMFPFLRNFYSLEVYGKRHLSGENGPFIFISNHQSHLDTPAILDALPHPFCSRMAVAAWAEFFEAEQEPFLERMRKRMLWDFTTVFFNIFPVPQSRGARKSLRYMGELLNDHWNILFYPEGIRSIDGTMHPFQKGLRVLVREMGVPIVPLRIDGLFEVYPRWRSWPDPGRVQINIGKPIQPKFLRKNVDEDSIELYLRERIQNMAMNKPDSRAISVTVYSKENCPLCHETLQEISRIVHDRSVDTEIIRIESDQSLYEEYKESVPVVFVEEELASKGPLNERRFTRLLDEAVEDSTFAEK